MVVLPQKILIRLETCPDHGVTRVPKRVMRVILKRLRQKCKQIGPLILGVGISALGICKKRPLPVYATVVEIVAVVLQGVTRQVTTVGISRNVGVLQFLSEVPIVLFGGFFDDLGELLDSPVPLGQRVSRPLVRDIEP